MSYKCVTTTCSKLLQCQICYWFDPLNYQWNKFSSWLWYLCIRATFTHGKWNFVVFCLTAPFCKLCYFAVVVNNKCTRCITLQKLWYIELYLSHKLQKKQTADSYLFVNFWWPSGLLDSGLIGQSNVIKTGIVQLFCLMHCIKGMVIWTC